MTPKVILKEIRSRDNIFAISHAGNKKMWFSTQIPSGLPVGNQIETLKTVTIPSRFERYTAVSGEVSGWLSWWQHTGGKLSEATAFISLLPRPQEETGVAITRCEPIHRWEPNGDFLQFGLDREWLVAFMVGIEEGLQTALQHPLANIEVRILNAIVDGRYSDLNAFQLTGKWLVEQLTTELYRRGFIPA